MSQAKRDYSAFDYRTWKLVTSPSAVETFNDCERKWWFLKVIRLKEPLKDFSQLGDVFHECAERWLLADDNGVDRTTGQPVEVFPEGWDAALDFGQSAVVRAVFKKMVDEGVLRRTPNRRIEHSFQIGVLPEASIMGFMDVDTPQGVEDHKTSKSTKWLKSRKALTEDIQMMTYAAAWITERYQSGGELPSFIELRHNQAVVDPEALLVRATAVDVELQQIEKFWEETLVPLVRKMLYWKQAELPASSWAKVDGPKRKGACRKYGGCPFVGICGRTESIDNYKTRTARYNDTFTAAKAKDQDMSNDLLAKLAAKKKARGATPPPVPANEETEPVAEAEMSASDDTTADVAEQRQVAPWVQADCKACGGVGLSTSGTACRPCAVAAVKLGIVASDFTLTPVEGAIEIRRGDVLLSTIPIASEVKTEEKTKPVAANASKKKATSKAAKALAASSEKESEAKQAVDASEQVSEQAETKPKGRPKKGFTLLYGVPKRHKGKVIDLGQIMQREGEELATAWNANSFWALDAFKRREAMAQKAAILAEEFGPALVVVTSDQRDLADLATALEPFAVSVYYGIS